MSYQEKESTITKSPDEIIKTEILERRAKMINAVEKYYTYDFVGGTAPLHEVKSRLMALFNCIQASLARSKEGGIDWCKETRKKIIKGGSEEVFEVIDEIEEFLDDKKLTRFDNITEYDYTRIEEDNERAGL